MNEFDFCFNKVHWRNGTLGFLKVQIYFHFYIQEVSLLFVCAAQNPIRCFKMRKYSA